MSTLAHVVQQLRKERNQALRSIEQLDKALKALGGLGGVRGRVGRVGACSDARQETKNNVSGGAQANCSSPARALGKVESSTAEQVSGRLCTDAIGSRQRERHLRGHFCRRRSLLIAVV